VQVRERDWSNVVTAHEGDPKAYVWRLQQYTLGEWVLFPPPKELAGAPLAAATTVCVRWAGLLCLKGLAGLVEEYRAATGWHRT
jgi:U3 small nucleolar RNA-associated protein 21